MGIGPRIRQYRRARGLTLGELAERMEPPVSKQALSKFERDLSTPRPRTLGAIARALEVRAAQLMSEPEYQFELVAFRKLAALPVNEQERIESAVRIELERRLALMDTLGLPHVAPFGDVRFQTEDVSAAEYAAEQVRVAWDLGRGPIASVVDTLESRGVHVVEVDTAREFDGLAVVASDDAGMRVACGVAARREVSRVRQRMSLAHEVGHLALEARDEDQEERAARRFAGAFLYPAVAVRDEFGARRSRITTDELLVAKQRWGMSIQAILYRLHDLEILDDLGYTWWCKFIDRAGWRRIEPAEHLPERSRWSETYAHRAAAEGLISREMLAEYVPAVASRTAPDDIDRKALVRLPLEERRALMKAHADAVAEEYNRTIDHEWLESDLGDADDCDG